MEVGRGTIHREHKIRIYTYQFGTETTLVNRRKFISSSTDGLQKKKKKKKTGLNSPKFIKAENLNNSPLAL